MPASPRAAAKIGRYPYSFMTIGAYEHKATQAYSLGTRACAQVRTKAYARMGKLLSARIYRSGRSRRANHVPLAVPMRIYPYGHMRRSPEGKTVNRPGKRGKVMKRAAGRGSGPQVRNRGKPVPFSAGFWSQRVMSEKRPEATRLPASRFRGALDRIRTCGFLLRRQTLYPLSYKGARRDYTL